MATKKKKNYADLIASCDTGVSMIENRTMHMKLQGFSGSGKTHFYLTLFNDMAKGLKPEEALLCIIDCDLEGQADLIARDAIMAEPLRPSILRKVCSRPDEVNDMVLAFIDLMHQHKADHPDGVRMIVLENEGAFYVGCRNHYAESVHGLSEADLLLARQQQALREGKKTLPTFEEGQMHSYKVINRLFVTPYERLKMGAEMCGAHFIGTTLMKTRTEGYGTAAAKEITVSAGRPDMTDPLFDWILEFSSQQRIKAGELEVRHMVQVKKSRSCKPFLLDNPTQERFKKAVEKSEA
tara:strand:- start:1840 stop:2724 length:885 start_codon:yes stop_codon:yes gene_type:complete